MSSRRPFRATALAANTCGGPPPNAPPSITAPADPIATEVQGTTFTVSLTGTDDGGVYGWSAAAGTGVTSVSVTSGQGTATATFSVTVGAAFVGTATFTASLTDSVNTAVTQVVNINVTTPPAAAPPAPTGLTALAGNGHVNLTWTAALGASGYNVKRSTVSGSGYVTIGTPPTIAYDDATAANGTTYFYVVSATNTAGESGDSSEVSATPNVIDVVISQVYGGGGAASGATYKSDYIELFNRGNSTANLAGYSLQYASGIGGSAPDFATANVFALPSGTSIGAGKYLLVQTGTPGTAGLDLPVAADLTAALNLSATSGKVALANISTALNCGSSVPCVLPDTRIADLVSYGASTNAEGGATVNNGVALTNTQGSVRKFGGCQDTNNNRDDFDVVTAPTPRNSASIANLCSVANAAPSIVVPSNPIATVAQNAAAFTASLTGSDDRGIYVWSAVPVNGIASVTVAGGQSTTTVTYSVTLQAGFYGTATFTALLSDGINPAVAQAVNIDVTPTPGVDNPPLIVPPADPITTVNQNAAPFTVNVTGTDDHNAYQWSASSGTGIDSVTIAAGQGTATVSYNVTVRSGFSGTATFTTSLSDGVNPLVSITVRIAVRLSGPHVVISQVYGGGGNSGAAYTNDFVELFNPTTLPVDLAGWTVQYASAAGDFTQFQPLGGVIAPNEYYLIALASNGAIGAALPTANIAGSLNLSGSNGKVALASNGDFLTGCSDPDVIDLVGYGGTASCWEGTTFAPTPGSNAKALLRNGNIDTDQNGSDFSVVTPNPRRTAPITEIGPSVVSTDPSAGNTVAPRDANITVNFTEPVDVNSGWFGIVCATTGFHNDATVASIFGGSGWVIVPNVNFTAGETCTVTVFKNFVHDVDLDDSAPNTDTLANDYTWTFTVSTGAPPPYPPSVHLTMGNPSGAVADLNTPNNYLMEKPEYAESYNHDRGTPNWVSWHLASEWYGSLARVDTFRADPAVSPTWYRVLGTDFSGSGFDRGHMCPNADRDGVVPINQATYLMANMLPQSPDNNQGPWASFEAYLRTLTDLGNELYIVSGPAGTGGTGSNGFATTIANGHVTVPASTWKVVMVLPKASGDDVARVTPTTRTIAIVIPNVQGIMAAPWQNYLTTVDAVEALTGYDFFSNVPAAIQAAIESGTDGTNPPGAANQIVSATEDAAKAFTLDAVSTSGNPLTYTIVTTPTHGALSGSGASQTYTPVPEFNGADSFTYRVNDGVRDSSVATVTINVAEVNDPPIAADDAKSTNSNGSLTFPAADLTVNDLAGAAYETAQTLTVTAVTATAQTHGTVMLSAGQITYVPDANFVGAAGFTYRVCDNGMTGGVSDPLCSTATVNVTVASCPAPAPAGAIAVKASVCRTSKGNVATAPVGWTSYLWQLSNGSITSGQGTASITFTAGANGVVSLSVTSTTALGCPGPSAAGSTRIRPAPAASLPDLVKACAGSSAIIPVMLTGTAPFTIVWSDGVSQTVTETSASRLFSASSNTTLEIVSLTDASCTSGAAVSTQIVVEGLPTFGAMPEDVTTHPGVQTTLTVTATPATLFQWYEGNPGDDSKLVGLGSSFTTPPLTHTTTYWVRASSFCGNTQSAPITLTVVAGRRRAAGH